MISWTTLGLGGIAAAVTAGWQQVKNVFNYASSFVITKATYDYQLSPVVFAHIKRNYKPLPSGLLVYVSLRLKMKDRKEDMLVPFRIPAQTSIYVKGRSILFVSANDRLEIRCIRGLTNFDKFTKKALEEWESHRVVKLDRSTRFYVTKVIGSEKGMGAFSNAKRKRSDNEDGFEQTGAPVGAGSSSMSHADINIDRSFMYDRTTYIMDDKVDPLDGLYFDSAVLNYFDQASRWYQLGDWYLERQIPWRRGWLLYGPGGTGKSSIAKAVAQKMGVPVYHFYLATLSDQEFIDRWDNMDTPCVALLEDFDNVFHGRENQTAHKSLTFDCVLNQISGVTSINGVFLIVTTNHLEHIDPAMGIESDLANGVSTRPGRIDNVIKVGFINADNRRKMAQRILRDWPDLIEETIHKHIGMSDITPIQWQETLIQVALQKMRDDEDTDRFIVQQSRNETELIRLGV